MTEPVPARPPEPVLGPLTEAQHGAREWASYAAARRRLRRARRVSALDRNLWTERARSPEDHEYVMAARERARDRLAELEPVVERGLASFIEVGLALTEIRDARLYRGTHPSFGEYVAARFRMARGSAYALIDAAAVAEVVSGTPDTPGIRTESHARALLPLLRDNEHGEEAVRAVWRELSEQHGDGITAAIIKEALLTPLPAGVRAARNAVKVLLKMCQRAADLIRVCEMPVEDLAEYLEVEVEWIEALLAEYPERVQQNDDDAVVAPGWLEPAGPGESALRVLEQVVHAQQDREPDDGLAAGGGGTHPLERMPDVTGAHGVSPPARGR